jgi:hypothetical protein
MQRGSTNILTPCFVFIACQPYVLTFIVNSKAMLLLLLKITYGLIL